MESKKPKYQIISENILYIFLALIFFYNVIGLIYNAFNFITIPFAITGTILIIIALIALFLFPKFKWKNSDGKLRTIIKFQKKPYLILLACLIGLWSPILFKYFKNDKNLNYKKLTFKPIFHANDSTAFNVLILDFEDYRKRKDNCIGRSIQENLNNIPLNNDITILINNQYVDSIKSPRSREDAKTIQNNHNADLIIYGLANNVSSNCIDVELAFRYRISDLVISKLGPTINAKAYKHDSDYTRVNTINLENDSLKVNSLTLRKWVTALVKVKEEKESEAFLELDEILKNSRDLLQLGRNTVDGEEFINFKEIPNRKNRYTTICATYFDLKKYQKALVVMNEAIKEYPEESNFYLNRGILLNIIDEYPEAILDLDKAILLDSTNIVSYLQKGEIYYSHKNYLSAISEFSKAISLDSKSIHGLNSRGASYLKLGQNGSAFQDFESVINLEPNNIMTLNNIAITYSELEQYDKALDLINKSIQINNQYAMAYSNKGIILSNMKNYKMSIESFNLAIKIDPNDAYSFNNRGYSYLKLNKPRNAFSDFEKSKKLDNTNSWLYRNIACYYIINSQNQLALTNLEKANKLGYKDLKWFQNEKLLDPLRKNESFQNLLKLISINASNFEEI